jgi:acyl-coenzyme A thioesterase PaaI-like protein
VSYIAPAKIGAFVCEARVVQIGKTIAFVEAKLMDAEGTLVATATTSARVIETAKLDSTKM